MFDVSDKQIVVQKYRQFSISDFFSCSFSGVMKFFGGLARFHPKEVLNSFQTFVGIMFSAISESDSGIKGLAIETVGFIGSTVEGKAALSKQGRENGA